MHSLKAKAIRLLLVWRPHASCMAAQSHNAMEVYVGPKDFITAQMVSTRDINAGLWNDWFTG